MIIYSKIRRGTSKTIKKKLQVKENIACVASVSVGFGSKERDFWCFVRAENGERAKNEIWGFALQFFAPEPHRNACYAG